MATTEEQTEAFHQLETALWIAETRGNVSWMNEVLSSTFTEHGQSGRVYSRAEILDEPIGDRIDVVLPLPDFSIRAIDTHVVLATYTSIVRGNAHNRASVWRHNGDRWLLEFHQGTPAGDAVPTPDGLTIDPAILSNRNFNTSLRGYDKQAVDSFVEDLIERSRAGVSITVSDVQSQRFELALRGYDCQEVDTFLRELST